MCADSSLIYLSLTLLPISDQAASSIDPECSGTSQPCTFIQEAEGVERRKEIHDSKKNC
jgi:hypothetical protein